MVDIDLTPLGEALATVDGPLIYHEAKRQYEALLHAQHRNSNPSSTILTHQRVDLPTFYRLQFDNATTTLSTSQKVKLLHICFAYKTRERVLAYLDLLEEGDFDWVKPLHLVVQIAGRDTLFESTPSSQNNYPAQDVVSSAPSTRAFSIRAQAYFVITTLPIAFPSHYFSAWAWYVPLPRLTVENLLAQPCTYQMAHSRQIKNLLRTKFLPDVFWTGVASEDAAWTAFFAHLLGGRVALGNSAGDVLQFEGDGYGLGELGMWLEGWKVERKRGTGGGAVEVGGGRAMSLSAWGQDYGVMVRQRVTWGLGGSVLCRFGTPLLAEARR
ncbi:hypothetical protein N0V90_002176 [Kalmusia sp. IMI 367209]|nr:hypothetical protein N0V90_002176 [Kalmusia sp. IMI 367209]